MVGILWTILVIAVVVWLLGLLLDFGGSFIHVLLIVAAAILIYNLITGRRAV
jgi:predicted membrane metal-binding protein